MTNYFCMYKWATEHATRRAPFLCNGDRSLKAQTLFNSEEIEAYRTFAMPEISSDYSEIDSNNNCNKLCERIFKLNFSFSAIDRTKPLKTETWMLFARKQPGLLKAAKVDGS